MPDPYERVTRPDPERQRLMRSILHPSSLEEVAEAVSVATEKFHDIYVERQGDQYRWSFATRGGPYPLLRITARFLEMDPATLRGVGSRAVGEGWCVQIVDDEENKPDISAVLRFDSLASDDEVRRRIEGVMESGQHV